MKHTRKKAKKYFAKYYIKKQLKKLNGEEKGYIYIISSPTFKDWIKIGRTTNDPKIRVTSFNVATPFRDFVLDYIKEVENTQRAEYQLHEKVHNNKLTKKRVGEWFKITNKTCVISARDDNQETIITRYEEYMKKTKPVLDFYSSRSYFHEIDGRQKIQEITSKIEQILTV